MPEDPRCQPSFPGDICWGPRARMDDQPSRWSRALARGPGGSTSCHGQLGPVPEGTRCPQRVPGESGPCPRAHSFDPSPGRLGPEFEGPRGRPAVPGGSLPGLRACRFDQLSRATRDRDRGPMLSNSSPERLALRSEGPRGGQAVPGDSGPGPMARGVDQLSRMLRALVRGSVGWTSPPE